MKVPYSWLKDYVDITVSPEELSKKLFSCGFEVEEIVYLGEKVSGVVVGQIESIVPHPDSDHMSICQVNVGEQNGGVLQIVTGATNIFEGMKTPCALDGSTVLESDERMLQKNPSGIKKIKKGKLRGVDSFGMLCSGEELGINDDYYDGAEVYGLLVLADDVPVGEDIKKVVGLDDYIFDISITANRPDCQSVLGIAREVAAVLKKPLKMPATDSVQKTTSATPITVEVQATDLCPRYMGHYVQNVKGVKTPDWMRRRLAVCGIRSISPIVDITNFVLLEIGQPMHAFDADKLAGNKIVVRRATAGETIKTLDEKEFVLKTDNLVICDAEKPVALAGVMGGADSGISDETKNVYFESAKFARDSVRKTSRALGQISDSSLRFEKGVDAYSNALGLARALHLIEELGCGEVTCVSADECAVSLENRVMQVSLSKIFALLGIEIPQEDVVDILDRLCFKPVLDGDTLTVEVPAYRDDVDGYPDIAEELIRMYGYDHIIPTFLEKASVTGGGLDDKQKKEMHVKGCLTTQGYYEAYNYSFYSPKDFDLMKLPADAQERNAVKILNPISEELSVMRTFLSPSMLANAVRNIRRGNDEGREFEVANIYIPNGENAQPIEKKRLVLGVWGAKCDFFDMKGAFESLAETFHLTFSYERADKPFLHPGVSAYVICDKQVVGYFGELDPAISGGLGLDKKVYLGELDLEFVLEKGEDEIAYKNLPKFPDAKRDLALLVDEKYTCAEVEEVLNHSCKYVTKVEMFDLYRGKNLPEGKKSMAFTLTFAVPDTAEKAFSAEDLDGYVKKILNNLKFKLGVELR